jgi:hypothetical protein
MIIRQRFTIGLTLQDFLRCLYLHLFSTFLIVKILGVKLFCSPRFERLAEKDDDKQLSRQFLYFLGVCLFWRASDRSIGAGDSTVLRRFAGSAELRQFVVLIVFRRASSAELRQYLVCSACWRASSAELRQFVVLIVFRHASSAELRQYLVLSACWRASSAELRQFLVLRLTFGMPKNVFS